LGAVVATAWAGFWGLVTWNVITDNTGAAAIVGGLATAVAALLPAAMLVLQRRRKPALQPSFKPPVAVRPSYRRLVAAHQQAEALVAEGVIAAGVLRGVDQRIEALMHLMAADVSNQRLGGRSSKDLRAQIDELTSLLVGLVDAALDRQTAALDSDNQAAASLREALGRMRAEEQGYRELGELDDRR
jgi:hypothetical protein